MQIKKLIIESIIIILIFSSVLTIANASKSNSPPMWSSKWSYREEIQLPISTDNTYSIYQPIDIKLNFEDKCWAKNESIHSIRVCCWDGSNWHELESQIYDLEYSDTNIIDNCRLVFLIPKIADGHERYFVYYDDSGKDSPGYIDHVEIEDAYYYVEPIPSVSVEGDYYKIIEDGYCIYGIGQKGNVMDRGLSQSIIKEKKEAKEFSAICSDQIASFYFCYHTGPNDEDEVSSDRYLVSKEVFTDGNLMTEFGIVSESANKHLRTTNFYKYYYCPTLKKRINVHVKHEVLEQGRVKGIIDIDGRYGSLISIKSRSERIQKMCFGDIHPYLHIYGEDDTVKKYHLNVNPESKKREWILSVKDDCDLGSDAWISYDNGEKGKTHAILFSSNKNIVKRGAGERDGIQLTVSQQEYFDIVGTEIDYAAINFGRNSYEKGGTHDINIPDDLIVEFNAEFFTTEEGSYKDVIEEGKIFQVLAKSRFENNNELFNEKQNIHKLTVIPHFGSKIFSFPRLAQLAGFNLPVTWVELYQDETLISSNFAYKPFVRPTWTKFPKLAAGEYIVKVYRKFDDNSMRFIGVEPVLVEEDTLVHVYCSWQKTIRLFTHDQNGNGIENVELSLLTKDKVFFRNITNYTGKTKIDVPFNLFNTYDLKMLYKGFDVYDEEILMKQKNVDVKLDLYELTIEVRDKLGLSPGADIRLILTSSEMQNPIEIIPDKIGPGRYFFEKLPSALFELRISYGSFSDKKTIYIPDDGDSANIDFSAVFNLGVELYNSRGEPLSGDDLEIKIIRDGQTIYKSLSPDEVVLLPPSNYTIKAYSSGKLIGSKTIELTNDRNIKIVTISEPVLPVLVTGLVLIFVLELIVLLLFKKISLNTMLKLIAMSLILISLFQPWWALNASSEFSLAEKNSEMFIVPQTMIDRVDYDDSSYFDLATIPEEFTDFLGILLFVVCSGFILLGISFIPNIVLKRRFSTGLIFTSILFLVLVTIAFSVGMSKICEITLGSLQGEGMLDVILPTSEVINMSSSWGLGIGFYLCVSAALIAMTAGILDYIKNKKLLKCYFVKKTT